MFNKNGIRISSLIISQPTLSPDILIALVNIITLPIRQKSFLLFYVGVYGMCKFMHLKSVGMPLCKNEVYLYNNRLIAIQLKFSVRLEVSLKKIIMSTTYSRRILTR